MIRWGRSRWIGQGCSELHAVRRGRIGLRTALLDYLKDWSRLSHSGRNGMNRLKEAMLLIANDEPLPPEWLDHPLTDSLWTGRTTWSVVLMTRIGHELRNCRVNAMLL